MVNFGIQSIYVEIWYRKKDVVIWEQEKYINKGKEEKVESSNQIFKEKW